jgi:hypothetical protein
MSLFIMLILILASVFFLKDNWLRISNAPLRTFSPAVYYIWVVWTVGVMAFIFFLLGKKHSLTFPYNLSAGMFVFLFFGVLYTLFTFDGKKSSLLKALIVLSFISLCLNSIGSLYSPEQISSEGMWKIGFPFGNQGDFYSSTINQKINNEQWLSKSGYLPFSLALGILEGYLMHWNGKFNPGFVIPQPWAYLVYISTFLICFFPILIQLSKAKLGSPMAKGMIYYFVIMSYPVLFAIERGNYVIFATMLLSIFFLCINQNKFSLIPALALSLFFSMTIKYWIFLPVFLWLPFSYTLICVVLFFLVQYVSFSFIYNYGTFDFPTFFSGTISNILNSGSIISWDAEKIFGYGGLDALIKFLYHMCHSLSNDFELKLFNFHFSFLIPAILLIYFWKLHEKSRLVDFCIIAITTLYLFHPLTADYNLLMLLPLFIVLVNYNDEFSNWMALIVALFFIPFSVLPLMPINWYQSSHHVLVTCKHFLSVPVSFTLIVFILQKNIVLTGGTNPFKRYLLSAKSLVLLICGRARIHIKSFNKNVS